MTLIPDFTLFIQIANFLLLIFLLNIVLYRPIRKILRERRDEEDALQGMINDFEAEVSTLHVLC